MKGYSIGLLTTLFVVGCGGGSDASNKETETVPSVVENSSACFNPDLYQIGTEIVEEYAQTLNGGSISNYSERQVMARTLSYEGYNDVLEIESVSNSGDADSTFIVIDNAAKSVRTLGSQSGGLNVKHKPDGILLEYNLDAGETREYPTITTYENGVESSIVDMTVSFIKHETVTVPAGTFDTCLFKLTMNAVDASGITSETVVNQNVGVGIAHTIKETMIIKFGTGSEVTTTSELVSATVNGTSI